MRFQVCFANRIVLAKLLSKRKTLLKHDPRVLQANGDYRADGGQAQFFAERQNGMASSSKHVCSGICYFPAGFLVAVLTGDAIALSFSAA